MLNGDRNPSEDGQDIAYAEEREQRMDLPLGLRRELARKRSWLRLADAWMAAASAQVELARKQEELARRREQTRVQKEADRVAAWKEFMRRERHEIELRKAGQLARLLGEPMPGELPDLLRRLAAVDQMQARRGLVALMSGGNTLYKELNELSPEDMPARIAANRLRTTWLKERRDGWLGRGEIQL